MLLSPHTHMIRQILSDVNNLVEGKTSYVTYTIVGLSKCFETPTLEHIKIIIIIKHFIFQLMHTNYKIL